MPAPTVPPFAVDRPSLVDRLDQALARRMVLLVAPAGYGKSVLLAQWAAARPGRRVAWVSAGGIDGDAQTFGRRLVASLKAADPVLVDRLDRQPGTSDQLGPVFLDHVVDGLAEVDELTIVIEDFEDLTAPALLAEVGQLAVQLPSPVRLVIASRHDPAIGLHRLRLRDEVDEIRQDDLAMTEDQARAVVRTLAECELRADQAHALVARTEGWPAGLQLAALSLRDRDDVEGYLEDFSGDDRHVADYLSDEILDGLHPEEREFLLTTSVLDRLHGPLCDELTGRVDGQRTLASLHRRSLFLTALDDHRSWYRCHALFRGLLRYELRATRPGDEDELHDRAATWLIEHGQPSEAAEHLLAAGDWDAVVVLADRLGREYFERGEGHVLLGWLERLPREVIESRPDVALSIALLKIISGQALAAEDLAERTARAHELSLAHAAVVDMVRVALVYHHGAPSFVLTAARRMIDRLPELAADPTPLLLGLTSADDLQTNAQANGGRAELLLGHVGEARRWLQAASDGSRYPPWTIHCVGTMAYGEALAGRLQTAEDCGRRALAVAAETGLLRHTACADAHLALAHVHRQRGELATAEGHLEEALAAARSNRRHLLIAVHRAEWSSWLLASGRLEAMVKVLTDHAVGEPPSPPGVEARQVATQARLLLAVGRAERAAMLLLEHDGLRTCDVAAAEAAVAASQGDIASVRKIVHDWPTLDEDERWSRLQRGLWDAVVLDADGDKAAADRALGEVLALAEHDGHIQLFRDGGRDGARLLRRRYLGHPTPYLRRVVEAVADGPAAAHSSELIEQLSERELEVLRYLPSRLSNAEIAARLYVSVNTLKTHVKAIYRKLGVTSRAEAVERAEALDLA